MVRGRDARESGDGKAARRMGELDERGGDKTKGERQAFVLRGDELRRLRVSVGLTQRALAARLAYSPAQVCAWEQGRSAIPRGVWDAIRREIETERRERAEWEQFMAGLHLPQPPLSGLSSLLISSVAQIATGLPAAATASNRDA